ncbi:MAG: M12 family metallo-peptidase [Ignavibacterium sp.]|nr:M12 family metallo-peptidase [Ignavibacterium sp.]MDW8374707.1 M12 family metallo-peptidase [Ignavibacteriales bacterium]
MKKNFFNFLSKSFLIFFISFTSLYPQYDMWQEKNESDIVEVGQRYIIPKAYKIYQLNINALTNLLSDVPMEFTADATRRAKIIYIPMPDGSFQRFRFVESPVMSPELQRKAPHTRTFLGYGIDDKYASVRFDFTPNGFHAMILSPNGRVFVDPYSKGDIENYISYYTRDYHNSNKIRDCELDAPEDRVNEINYLLQNVETRLIGPQLRTYRLALACTGEYATFHGGTITSVRAAMVTSVNRVVGVYEKELGIRMVLVPNNDTLIFLDPNTDPYTNNSGTAMLSQNQTTIDSRIGSANYDIGHVFSTGGGGVASLACVCVNGLKARGVTGSPQPVGDPFDIDYVAHEMGHQFGANHTFNSVTGSCSGNRVASKAYEPGSGSTIMAYAGICGSDNLQNFSDPYFHVASYDEIVVYTNNGTGNSCAQITNTGNSAPIVTVPSGGFYIPRSTPFSLTGSATDPNGDPLTYDWQQYDLGPAGTWNNPSGNAPIFRVWNPTTSPTRTFPRLQNLLNNTTPVGEVMPTYSRTLTFRMVVRDNRAGGGGVDYAQIQFQVDGNSGPFQVTYPNTNLTLPGLSTQTITWDVANTNLAPVNCSSVNIRLSLDGGNTFPILLASNTPNDGSETVTLPANQTTQARIRVEAVGNIFFDISNVNFSIQGVIPVELVSFTHSIIDKGVLLNWKTATETNNAGFSIERSRDNQNYTEIGFVGGNGTTTQPQSYSFIDDNVEYGKYYYRLKQIDYDGKFSYVGEILVDIGTPNKFSLEQNYPNPFNPVTNIKFTVPEKSFVTIKVFNALGQEISKIVDGEFDAGVHKIDFDASELTSGVYYYKMETPQFSQIKKMIVVK